MLLRNASEWFQYAQLSKGVKVEAVFSSQSRHWSPSFWASNSLLACWSRICEGLFTYSQLQPTRIHGATDCDLPCSFPCFWLGLLGVQIKVVSIYWSRLGQPISLARPVARRSFFDHDCSGTASQDTPRRWSRRPSGGPRIQLQVCNTLYAGQHFFVLPVCTVQSQMDHHAKSGTPWWRGWPLCRDKQILLHVSRSGLQQNELKTY